MESESSGPIDLITLVFPGNQFNGEILPALRDLVVTGQIRLLDLLFVYKDVDGSVGSLELADLGPDLEPFVDVDGQVPGGLLDEGDVEFVTEDLPPGSSIAVLAVENRWAVPFIQAVRGSGGELLDHIRVPSDVVDAVRAGETFE